MVRDQRWLLATTFYLMLAGCGGGGGGGSDSDSDGAQTGGGPNTLAVAVAGGDMDVARDVSFSLDGSASTDADGDSLTYTWTQTLGPDVTGGTGVLNGEAPVVVAPTDVSTLVFDLVVNDGRMDSSADRVQINVMEDPAEAVFVDGDAGDDGSGDGSRGNPYATIGHALSNLPGSGHDIYVKTWSGIAYTEYGGATSGSPGAVSLTVPTGTSLYGGFGLDWVRDVVGNRTPLQTRARGIRFKAVDHDTWISGFSMVAFNPLAWATPESYGVSADSGAATLYVQDNAITSGDVNGESGSSYGVRVSGVIAARILRNTISAGDGGHGAAGANGLDGKDGGNGSTAGGQSGASAGDIGSCAWGSFLFGTCEGLERIFKSDGGSASASIGGGNGGSGGNLGGVNGNNGFRGFRDGDPFNDPSGASGGDGGFGGSSTNSGRNGSGGFVGTGKGQGGIGGDGHGRIAGGTFVNNSAGDGNRGGHGGGGGGGGGGEGGVALFGDVGGGGGGGGSGGVGGKGGEAGSSGGASIGILVSGIPDVVIEDNVISSASGGNGGAGGDGGQGGDGGDGGSGRAKVGDGESGGKGGGGAHGGEGGQGGAGGGGPSYGVLVDANMAPEIVRNTFAGGTGGQPGADGDGANGGANGGRWGDPGNSSGTGATGYQIAAGGDGSPAEGGWSYNVFDMNPSDGLVPSSSGNSFNAGTAGSDGQVGVQNF